MTSQQVLLRKQGWVSLRTAASYFFSKEHHLPKLTRASIYKSKEIIKEDSQHQLGKNSHKLHKIGAAFTQRQAPFMKTTVTILKNRGSIYNIIGTIYKIEAPFKKKRRQKCKHHLRKCKHHLRKNRRAEFWREWHLISPAHYLLPRSLAPPLMAEIVPVVQLVAHAKSSTLYGRSYGHTSKFFRLDGLLLFRTILRAANSALNFCNQSILRLSRFLCDPTYL